MSLPKPNLQIPNLDDRSFDDLMREARSLIPIYNKDWTNHNPSDPGIMLLELFAWLSEMIIYRINQVPEENYREFLKLISIELETGGKGTISSHGTDVTGDGTVFTKELKVGDSIAAADQRRFVAAVVSDTSLTVDSAFGPELTAGTGFTYSSSGNGTISSRGEVVSGIGTAFVSELKKGYSITAVGQKRFVTAVASDMSLTVNSAFDPELPAGTDFTYSYESIESGIRRGLESISQQYRAISRGDYESLTKEYMENLDKGLAGRAICVDNRDLETGVEDKEKPGHVSVIIVPWCKKYLFGWGEIPGNDNGRLIDFLKQNYSIDWVKTAKIEKIDDGKTIRVSTEKNFLLLKLNDEKNKIDLEIDDGRTNEFIVKAENGKLNIYCKGNLDYCEDGLPKAELRSKIKNYLDARRLITTRVHVVAPDYQEVNLKVGIALKENTVEDTIKNNVVDSIKKYFSPLEGGQDEKGWQLGRNLYTSEIYQRVEGVEGVDHVVNIMVNGMNVDFVEIKEYQLISVADPIEIEVYHG